MFRNLSSTVSISLCLSPFSCHVLYWALRRHPKYNYSLQLNGEKGSLGIARNRKWSGGLDRGGNSKSLIQLAEPWQPAPGGSYCGIGGIKQCSFNRKRGFHPHTYLPLTHTDALTQIHFIFYSLASNSLVFGYCCLFFFFFRL